MATTKQSEPVRAEILEFVRKTEETIAEGGRKLSESVCDLVPGDRDSIRKVVDEAFDFSEAILKSQREFAHSLLDTVLGEPSGKRTPAAKRAPAKPAAKRTASKTTKHAGAA